MGGGRVAERKVRFLIRAGAEVKVVSPAITAWLARCKEQGQLKHVRRSYRKGDLKNAFVVVAATSSPETNTKIAHDAENLVNVVDPPSAGNFIVPSTVRRAPLTLAISTEGASPAVSKAIRKEIEANYDREFARYLRFVEKIRRQAMEKITDRKKREKFLKSLASEEAFRMLRNKGFRAISEKMLSVLK